MLIFLERITTMNSSKESVMISGGLDQKIKCPRCEGEGVLRMEEKPMYKRCKRCLGEGHITEFEVQYLRRRRYL